MNAIRSDKIESPLYIFDGAETPSGYKAELDVPNEHEITEPNADTLGFWERQLQKAVNKKSAKFDWIFGVIMPVICFAADPIVFKNSFGPRDGYLSEYRPFAYLLSFVSIMAMLAWLIWGEELKGLAAIVSGILASGAAVSLVIALLLLPLSLPGLIIIIGILGFTPFFTFVTFWRNSKRAFVAARPYFENGLLTKTAGLVALSALAIPMVVNAATGKNIVTRLIEIINR